MILKIKPEAPVRASISRLLLLMKLVVALILLNVTTGLAVSVAQQVTLNAKNTSLVQAMRSIQKQSGYAFFLNGKDLANIRVDANIRGVNVGDAMNRLLEGKPAEWVIENETIVIKPRPIRMATPSLRASQREISTADATVQQQLITGTVTDEFDNTPIVGVNVAIMGTTRGTSTDENGVYEISANEGDSLVFSFVGYETQKIAVGKVRIINVRLQSDMEGLEETVVVAFGTQRKESVVSSITTVNVRDLKTPSSNLTTALAGRMAGLVAYQSTGAPGEEDAQFFVRSVTSFGSGLVSPLILIDNIEMSSKDLSRLNPDDIASFSILKDASATALYGARGANGVVLV